MIMRREQEKRNMCLQYKMCSDKSQGSLAPNNPGVDDAFLIVNKRQLK